MSQSVSILAYSHMLSRSTDNKNVDKQKNNADLNERKLFQSQSCDLETMDSRLEFILSRSRSRSRDLMAKVSVFVSRPEDSGLGLGLET